MDSNTTIQQLRDQVAQFIKERDWNQFHTPKNLSVNIAIEAAELMEKFVWLTNEQSFKEAQVNKMDVSHEVVDVLWGLLCFCNAADIDLSTAFMEKIALNAQKYPIDKAKGMATKYNKL